MGQFAYLTYAVGSLAKLGRHLAADAFAREPALRCRPVRRGLAGSAMPTTVLIGGGAVITTQRPPRASSTPRTASRMPSTRSGARVPGSTACTMPSPADPRTGTAVPAASRRAKTAACRSAIGTAMRSATSSRPNGYLPHHRGAVG